MESVPYVKSVFKEDALTAEGYTRVWIELITLSEHRKNNLAPPKNQ